MPAITTIDHEPIIVDIDETGRVSALLTQPHGARACYVFAHGAGAGMIHPFMSAVAEALATNQIACLRYQFPYMERGSRRPDPPNIAQTAVRAAVREAAQRLPALPLFAGGKSFGGRMTSLAQASEPLPGVRGLAFLGFPLHPTGKPTTKRAHHLRRVDVPMLFVQGTRDTLADRALLRSVVDGLQDRATLHPVEAADHGFHVLKRSGRTDEEVLREVTSNLAKWLLYRA